MTFLHPLRLIFMGTPDFSVPALQVLIESKHDVIAVYSQPPRPSGRGHKVTKSPIQLTAESHGIPVFTPTSLRSQDEQDTFTALTPDIAIVAAYGLILPHQILDAPKHGCLNIHASLLPRWRGAAPIQRAILNGDKTSGITLMQMNEGLDTGDMLATESVDITPQTTGQSLHNELSQLGAKMLLPLLDDLQALTPEPQDEALVTYAAKLSKAEAELDFSKTVGQLEAQVRAFTPWPGSYFMWQGRTVKVLKAHAKQSDVPLEPGTFHTTKNTLAIACNDGLLHLETVQVQGKNPMDAKAFLNGYKPSGVL